MRSTLIIISFFLSAICFGQSIRSANVNTACTVSTISIIDVDTSIVFSQRIEENWYQDIVEKRVSGNLVNTDTFLRNSCVMYSDIGLDRFGIMDNTSLFRAFVQANPSAVICFEKGNYKGRFFLDNNDVTLRGIEEGARLFWDNVGGTITYTSGLNGSVWLDNLIIEETNPSHSLSDFFLDVGVKGGSSDRYIKATDCVFLGTNGNPALDSIHAFYDDCEFHIREDAAVAGLGNHSKNAEFKDCEFYGYQVVDAKSGHYSGCEFYSTGTYAIHQTSLDPLDSLSFIDCHFEAPNGFCWGNAPEGTSYAQNCTFRGDAAIFHRYHNTFHLSNCDVIVESNAIVSSKYSNPGYPNYTERWGGVSTIKNSTIISINGFDFDLPDTDQRGTTEIYSSYFDWNKVRVSNTAGSNVTSDDTKRLYLDVKGHSGKIGNYTRGHYTSLSTEPTVRVNLGDTYLDDGTNTASGNPAIRWWDGTVWNDL